MLHNGHLDASKAMSNGMISKIIKHINDNVQTITTHIIQGLKFFTTCNEIG
jgi:hypothetical protein